MRRGAVDRAGQRQRFRPAAGQFALEFRRLDGIADDGFDGFLLVGNAIDERGVSAVFEKSADEVGEQVFMAADRSIDAAGAAEFAFADDFFVERFAHSVQALQLEGDRTAGDMGDRERVRVVRGELGIERALVGQQEAHAREVGQVCVLLAGEHGIVGVTAFLRPFDLAVPIRALHEAHGDAFAAALGEPPQPAQHWNGALAVGLHREPQPRPAFKGGIEEQLAEQSECYFEAILFLGVDREADAERPCATCDFQKAWGQLAP